MMITDAAMGDGKLMNSSSIMTDGPTVALRPQIKRQAKWLSGVLGVRVTMADRKLAIHGAIIPAKTITATLDGEMMIPRVTRKGKVAAMGPRSESREADQAPAVTAATKAATDLGPTPGDVKKNTVAVAVQLGGKTAMCTGTKRRKRSAGKLNWRRMRRGVVVEAPRGNARVQDGTSAASVPAGKRHRNGELTLFSAWIGGEFSRYNGFSFIHTCYMCSR